jgi:hypothetical protein
MVSRITRAMCLMLGIIAMTACDVPGTPIVFPTASQTVTATPTSGIVLDTTATPTTSPTASVTPIPSSTPTMIVATCVPQLTGDLLVLMCADENGDKACSAGEEPVSGTVHLGYQGLLPEKYPMYLEITTLRSGVWAGAIVPGLYTVTLHAYDPVVPSPVDDLVPWYNYPGWVWISAGVQNVLTIPFWRYATTPIPLVTATPTVIVVEPATPTPTSVPLHQCAAYWSNCVPFGTSCGAGREADPTGQCGVGFDCCKVTTVAALGEPHPSSTPTREPCATPYTSINLRCCNEDFKDCKPLMCCSLP